MNKSIFGLTSSLFAIAASSALADIRTSPSQIRGAPEHRIPMSASQIAEVKVREILSEKLAATVILETQEAVTASADPLSDLDRIFAFADIPLENPTTEQVQQAPEGATNADDQPMTTSDEKGDVFADMTDSQMRFLALMAAAIQNPDDMMALASQSSGGAGEPTPSYENANASIMLRGWDVRMDGDGTTHLFQASLPNSSIELEQGIVIGALGAVTEIRRIGGEVHVFFESGDSISGEAYTMAAGIPPLPPLSDVTEPPQEVLLSYGPRAATEGNERLSTSGRIPEQSGFISLSAATPARNHP